MKQKEKKGSSPSKHKFTWDIDKNALQMMFEIKIYYSLMNFNLWSGIILNCKMTNGYLPMIFQHS